ncbi:unnamed protein product, partial [Choristocarpus tenellus]
MSSSSITPADNILRSAIQEVTRPHPGMSPSKVMAGLRKNRPDWTVNKRRVKKLLRDIKNETCQATMQSNTHANPAEDDDMNPFSNVGGAQVVEDEEQEGFEVGENTGVDPLRAIIPRSNDQGDGLASDGSSHCTEGSCDTFPTSPIHREMDTPVASAVVPGTVFVNVNMEPSLTEPVHLSNGEVEVAEGDKEEGGGEGLVEYVGEATQGLDQSLHLEPGLELEPDFNLGRELGLASCLPCIPVLDERVCMEEVNMGGLEEGEGGGVIKE